MLLIGTNWWSLAVRGVFAILLGLLTFVWPGITLSALVILFGAYALVDGVLSLAGAWRRSKHDDRWTALIVEGVVGLLAGVVTIFWPAITTVILVWIIAFWAIGTGIFEIAAAMRLRKHIAGEWLLGLIGVASVLFGIFLAAAPLTGALVIATWLGAYAIVFGVLQIVLAFRLRGWVRTSQPAV